MQIMVVGCAMTIVALATLYMATNNYSSEDWCDGDTSQFSLPIAKLSVVHLHTTRIFRDQMPQVQNLLRGHFKFDGIAVEGVVG